MPLFGAGRPSNVVFQPGVRRARFEANAWILRDGDKRNFVEDMQTRADIYDPIGLKDFETLDASIVATVLL